MMRTKVRFTVLLGAALALAGVIGCGERDNSARKGQSITHLVEADDAQVRFTMVAPEITLAEVFEFTIDFIAEESVESEVVNVGQALPSDWTIIDVQRDRLLDSDGRSIARSVYKVEPFLPGDYEFAPITVEYFHENSSPERKRLETISVPVSVLSPIEPGAMAAGPAEIRSVVDPIGPWTGWWWIGGSAIGLIVLAAVGALVWLKRRQDAWVERYRYRAAHEIANEALEALRTSGVLEREEYEILYVRLSDILRRYLAHRFDLHAPERTTEEILIEADRTGMFNEKQMTLLDRFLSYCDLVKFAARPTEARDAQQAFEVVQSFVKATLSNRPEVILDAETGAYVGRLELGQNPGDVT